MLDIHDLIATEHQFAEIWEIIANIIDVGKLIIGQFQELDIQFLGSGALHNLLNSPISDLLINQRNKLLLLLVDVLHHLRHQVVVLCLHLSYLNLGFALLEGKAEDYIAVFEGLYFFLGVEFRDKVYFVL